MSGSPCFKILAALCCWAMDFYPCTSDSSSSLHDGRCHLAHGTGEYWCFSYQPWRLLPCLQSLTFSACLGSAMPPSPVLATVFINRFQDCIQYFNSRYWISEVLWLVGQRLISVYLTWWANRYAPHSQVLSSVQLGFVLLSNNSTPWWVSLWKQGFLLSLEEKLLMA